MQVSAMRDEVAAKRFEVHTTVSDHFAWLRTRLSVESTLMSWLRTATGLIGFGFTIVQVIERLQTQTPGRPVLDPSLPRSLGLALIGAGVISLAVALQQYRQLLKYLWSGDFKMIAGVSEKPHRTPLFAVAIIVELVGIAAFVTVFFRLS
jgi:putative membrane protein